MRTCPVQITRLLQGGCVCTREAKRRWVYVGLRPFFYDGLEMQMSTCSVQVSRWYRKDEHICKTTPGIYVEYIVHLCTGLKTSIFTIHCQLQCLLFGQLTITRTENKQTKKSSVEFVLQKNIKVTTQG